MKTTVSHQIYRYDTQSGNSAILKRTLILTYYFLIWTLFGIFASSELPHQLIIVNVVIKFRSDVFQLLEELVIFAKVTGIKLAVKKFMFPPVYSKN